MGNIRRYRFRLAALLLTVPTAAACIPADDTDAPLVRCETPSAAHYAATIDATIAWLGRALQHDGTYWYEYDRAADEFVDDYNDVRHAGTTMSLYQAAADGYMAAIPIADAALEYILGGLVTEGAVTAFAGGGRNAELGSTALAIAGLVHRRIATGDATYDELLGQMGNFMRTLLRADGGMWARAAVDNLEPAEGQTSTFYTGEAFWAFGLLGGQFPEAGWTADAQAVGRYIATERDAEEEIEDPPLADQWAAYGFAELAVHGPLEQEERFYVRSLIERYHGRYVAEVEREARRVGDGSAAPDESVTQSRGASYGTTLEALGSLRALSASDPGLDDLRAQLTHDSICGSAIALARQYSPERAAKWPRPDVVAGAWFDENTTRMDDQQHAMSGVLLAARAAQSG